jgi:hypothetical protein
VGRAEFLIGELYHVPFLIFGALSFLQPPQAFFPSRARAYFGNEFSTVEQRCDIPNHDLRVKCHLCESRWDEERLARMPHQSLDLAVTLEKAALRLTVILQLYDVSLPYGYYRHAY